MGLIGWVRTRFSASKGFKDREAQTAEREAGPETFEGKAKGFKGERRKYEIQDPNEMLAVMRNMTVLLRDRDEELKVLRLDNRELNKENREMIRELEALKVLKGSQRLQPSETAVPSNSAIGKLLKALKAKPLTYEEIRNVLALQSKSGAYSYVSMAIAQGHPIGKMQEGRSRKVIRTDVTYGSQAGS